jgi:hypothetical protein
MLFYQESDFVHQINLPMDANTDFSKGSNLNPQLPGISE